MFSYLEDALSDAKKNRFLDGDQQKADHPHV
jgi:hypothetical protein